VQIFNDTDRRATFSVTTKFLVNTAFHMAVCRGSVLPRPFNKLQFCSCLLCDAGA